jgi:hypothetical protein
MVSDHNRDSESVIFDIRDRMDGVHHIYDGEFCRSNTLNYCAASTTLTREEANFKPKKAFAFSAVTREGNWPDR